MRSYFGYPPVEGFIACWGARAIFKPSSSRPLDLLPDRQGVQLAVEDDRHEALVDQIVQRLNNGVLDDLSELAGKWFSADSSDRFVKHYEWLHDSDCVLVATGSPNGSYGYFYVSVSLIKKSDAPEEQKPPEQQREEDRLVRRRQLEQEDAEARERAKPIEQAKRDAAKAKQQTIEQRVGDSDHKEEGETLEVGDHFYIEANQGDRDAFVLAVKDDEAFAKYHMPNGREFLVVVDRDGHYKLRNVSASKVPQKWLKLIDVDELEAA